MIAEAGVNHNGSIKLGKRLVDVAVDSGANAVKFQTFKAERIVTRYAEMASYQKKNTGRETSQLEMLEKLELDIETHVELMDYCKMRGIQFLSTPFDAESVDLLVKLGVPLIKISSGEITNALLLYKIGWTGLPAVLSTGMATLGEIQTSLSFLVNGYSELPMAKSEEESLLVLKASKSQRLLMKKVTLMHCTTEYPAPMNEVNLRAIQTLKRNFGLRVGYSDHTEGIIAAVAAVAMGAEVIEKHFTLDRTLPGPDHGMSLEPSELTSMIKSIRTVETALGSGQKIPSESELRNRHIVRKSLVASSPIKRGEEFTEANLGIKRPGSGISPFYYQQFLGKIATRDYEPDEMIES